MGKAAFSGSPVRVHCPIGKTDIYEGLALQDRTKGHGKRIFQLALAAVLTVGFAVSYIRDRTYLMGLVLAGVCALSFAVILVMPRKIRESTANMLADNIRELSFAIYEDGVEVDDGFALVPLPAEDIKVYGDDGYLVFETGKERLYMLPKRYLNGIDRELAEGMLEKYPFYYRFQTK